ncbi:SH3 domain and tetratricopeptide repeat-containing protein 2 isoform X2 [Ambystoma mexicanum]|uniref:SH3 domain and tetratricopeptide repeat-containing protein 2 isoform X2 n=1 Tax=Ambystoma mexicanum TaxID=8296 RepID=UPI0037E9092F
MGCCGGVPLLSRLFPCPDKTARASADVHPGNLSIQSGSQSCTAESKVTCLREQVVAPDLSESMAPETSVESPVSTESVSLAVGEGFPTEILLTFCILRRSTQRLNVQLQEKARRRLWALESDNKEVITLFKELSARLLSIQALEDLFVITFKTVEEVWKFSTYMSLGYVACCLEHLLLDQNYWLNSHLVEDTEIQVAVNEDDLATLYLGLLLQEGHFFARVIFSVFHPQEEEDSLDQNLSVCTDELLQVKDVGEKNRWDGLSLSTGQHGLVPVCAVEPLSFPFYQWFLKNYPLSCSIPRQSSIPGSSTLMGQGTCSATKDHRSTTWDELNICDGEDIEIIGFLLPALKWFVGKSTVSGAIGFVQTQHVDLSCCKSMEKHGSFLSEQEKSTLLLPKEEIAVGCAAIDFLHDLAQTDISSVYRLDGAEPVGTLLHAASEIISDDFDSSYTFDAWQVEDNCQGSTKCSFSEKSSPTSEFPFPPLDLLLQEPSDLDDPKFYVDLNAEELDDSEVFDPILTFLDQEGYVPHFQCLYDLPFSCLHSTFYGFSDEDQLSVYLERSRTWAKRNCMTWAHVRSCFLLGRLCAKRMKLSQARVYFEEATNALTDGFADLPLLAALYGNLTAIYLKQKIKEKQEAMLEKAATLLACLPSHCFCTDNEQEVVTYLLRKAIMAGSASLEVRGCFLMVSILLQLGRYEEVLPFMERLQFLLFAFAPQTGSDSLDATPFLSYLYDKKYMPHIALASARLSSPSSLREIHAHVWIAVLVLQNIAKILGCQVKGNHIPAQVCPYLRHALSSSCDDGVISMQRTICTILSKLYLQHRVLGGSIYYLKNAVELGRRLDEEKSFESLLSLGWTYMLAGQPEMASKLMTSLLESLQETESVTQCGVVYNLLGIAFKMENKAIKAAGNTFRALTVAKETGNRRNQAVALANFGSLALSCQARRLAENYFFKSFQAYCKLQGSEGTDPEVVRVLLWYGNSLVDRGQHQNGRLHFELALNFSLKSNDVKSQLLATQALCHYCNQVMPKSRQCIVYHEHWLSLANWTRDRVQQANLLETLSRLYQGRNTIRAFRKALDYTKQSLRIYIDLGETEKEAQAWLHAGVLYYLLREDELVEMYFQAAVQRTLETGDYVLALRLYEEAGDVFFNGSRNRQKAVAFYREGAIPLARKVLQTATELRLFHKLAELQIALKDYVKAREFATTAVRLSSIVGDELHELVAFHRLATVYYFLQMYEMAEFCYLKAASLCPSPLRCSKEAEFYARLYYRLGKLTLHNLKDTKDAVSYFLLALAASLEVEDEKLRDILRAKLAEVNCEKMSSEDQVTSVPELLCHTGNGCQTQELQGTELPQQLGNQTEC